VAAKTYRYYRLDGVGHLYDAEWFHAENDEAAVALIETKHPDAKCEIWQEERLVAKTEPARPNLN
jgi:hypothetical protein